MTMPPPAFQIVRDRTPGSQVALPVFIMTKPTASDPSSADRLVGGTVTHGLAQDAPIKLQYPDDYYDRSLDLVGQDPSQWGRQETFVCFHDCHTHTGLAIRLPIDYSPERGYTLLRKKFCSFACAKRHCLQGADYHQSKMLLLLTLMARQYYQFQGEVLPAPPREMLYPFDETGLSIEEFRSLAYRPVSLRLASPPFHLLREHAVSRPLPAHPDYQAVLQLEQRERRTAAATCARLAQPPTSSSSSSAVPEEVDASIIAQCDRNEPAEEDSSGGGGGGGGSGAWHEAFAYDHARRRDPFHQLTVGTTLGSETCAQYAAAPVFSQGVSVLPSSSGSPAIHGAG